jgi:cytochrome c5
LTLIKLPRRRACILENNDGARYEARLFSVVMIFAAALFAPARAADFERGKLLYSARCVGCHDKSVHNREACKALTIEGIRAQVRRWMRCLAARGAKTR